MQYTISCGAKSRAILKLSHSEVSCIGVLLDWRPTFFSGVFCVFLVVLRVVWELVGTLIRGLGWGTEVAGERMSPTTLWDDWVGVLGSGGAEHFAQGFVLPGGVVSVGLGLVSEATAQVDDVTTGRPAAHTFVPFNWGLLLRHMWDILIR